MFVLRRRRCGPIRRGEFRNNNRSVILVVDVGHFILEVLHIGSRVVVDTDVVHPVTQTIHLGHEVFEPLAVLGIDHGRTAQRNSQLLESRPQLDGLLHGHVGLFFAVGLVEAQKALVLSGVDIRQDIRQERIGIETAPCHGYELNGFGLIRSNTIPPTVVPAHVQRLDPGHVLRIASGLTGLSQGKAGSLLGRQPQLLLGKYDIAARTALIGWRRLQNRNRLAFVAGRQGQGCRKYIQKHCFHLFCS